MFHSQITENKISASQRLSVQSNKYSKQITKIETHENNRIRSRPCWWANGN
jgi:hypothetical protein